ncbi:MAG TPA: hypothetical protein PL125_07130 [Candidatus Omnitrophota bacterium]|nr:hypothetical protein [Candidatus Omnitrophota bacterium]
MNNLNKAVKIIYIFLISYICLIPFYYYPADSLSVFRIPVIKYFPLVLIGALLVISVARGSFYPKLIKADKLNLSILLYLFLTLLSGLGTAYYPVSVFKAAYYAATGILVYLIISSWDLSAEAKVYFFKSIVFTGFLAGLYGIFTLISGRDLFFSRLEYAKSNLAAPEVWLAMGRISSSLGNPLFLGGVLSLLFPMAIYLWLYNREGKKFFGILLAIQAGVIFLGLVFTFSIGALASVVFFYIYYLVKIKKNYPGSKVFKKVSAFLFWGAGACCLIFFVLAANVYSLTRNNSYIFGNFLGKIDFQKLTNLQSISLRWDSLKYAADFLKTPFAFFGAGIGKLGTGELYLSRVSLDNYWCLSLVESGVFTTLALGLVFWAALNRASEKREDPLYAFLRAGLIIFFINLLLNNH